jgi:hypothetical protein
MEPQKIFFSYSRMDSPFALKLAKDLREAGADIWIDQLDIQAGSHWDSAVEKALNTAACVLVIISPFSTSSTNVMDEVSFALETGKKIVPVMLEECPPPFRLRRLQRIDFTKDYNTGLTQLLLSLNLVSSAAKKPKDLVLVDPNGMSDQDSDGMDLTAEEAEDHMLWDDACRLNSIESYQKYMIKSTLGIFKNEAKLMIKQLELEEKEDELESLVWEKIRAENSLKLYQHYLDEYPDGDYKTLAMAAIASLDNQETLDIKAKESPESVALTNESISKPNRRKLIFGSIGLVVAAFLSIGLITINTGNKQENKAWQLASNKKDSISYAAYLLAFPNGKHIREAQLHLDSISVQNQLLQDSIDARVTTPVILIDTAKIAITPSVDTVVKSVTKSAPPTVKPKSSAPAKPISKFTIGQRHQGGIIVHISKDGAHGLIMADKDLGGFDWDSAKKRSDASKAANHYDWRLPTKDELLKMYAARFKTGAFSRGMYWSSTEAGDGMYWSVNLVDGSVGKFGRKMTWYVRPVRPF